MKCNSSETTIEERITYLEDERCSVEGIVLNSNYINQW